MNKVKILTSLALISLLAFMGEALDEGSELTEIQPQEVEVKAEEVRPFSISSIFQKNKNAGQLNASQMNTISVEISAQIGSATTNVSKNLKRTKYASTVSSSQLALHAGRSARRRDQDSVEKNARKPVILEPPRSFQEELPTYRLYLLDHNISHFNFSFNSAFVIRRSIQITKSSSSKIKSSLKEAL